VVQEAEQRRPGCPGFQGFDGGAVEPSQVVRDDGVEDELPVAAGVGAHRPILQEFTGVDRVAIHEMADPEVIITEYRLHGRLIATDTRFVGTLVMVAGVRDGLIAWSRTYSHEQAEPVA
jgi:hypothetical protein